MYGTDTQAAQTPASGSRKLFIVSAPSGAGKTSLVNALLGKLDHIVSSTSHTTRAPRAGEITGRDYIYVSEAQFRELINQNAFLEHAQVFGNWYGTAREGIEQHLAGGRDVVLEIDWQGARQIRQHLADAISIFILPPSVAELERRLRARGSDDDATIARRMAQAATEISHAGEYQHQIINADFDRALQALIQIISAARATR